MFATEIFQIIIHTFKCQGNLVSMYMVDFGPSFLENTKLVTLCNDLFVSY